jgi:hypothetical protein
MSAATRGESPRVDEPRIDEVPRGGIAMEVYHLREVPGGWNVAVVREAGRWRVHEATRCGADGRIRVNPPAPIGDGRFPSMTTAIEAAMEWLRRSESN